MPFPLGTPKGKCVPFRGVVPGCSLRPQPPLPTFPQIKPAKINIPFWQVLEADGEGDLMIVAGYGGAPAMGLGDGAHDG